MGRSPPFCSSPSEHLRGDPLPCLSHSPHLPDNRLRGGSSPSVAPGQSSQRLNRNAESQACPATCQAHIWDGPATCTSQASQEALLFPGAWGAACGVGWDSLPGPRLALQASLQHSNTQMGDGGSLWLLLIPSTCWNLLGGTVHLRGQGLVHASLIFLKTRAICLALPSRVLLDSSDSSARAEGLSMSAQVLQAGISLCSTRGLQTPVCHSFPRTEDRGKSPALPYQAQMPLGDSDTHTHPASPPPPSLLHSSLLP